MLVCSLPTAAASVAAERSPSPQKAQASSKKILLPFIEKGRADVQRAEADFLQMKAKFQFADRDWNRVKAAWIAKSLSG
jgi:hypothetical protein